MVRASDIVKQKTEATPAKTETTKTDNTVEAVRFSDFLKFDTPKEKAALRADKEEPIKDATKDAIEETIRDAREDSKDKFEETIKEKPKSVDEVHSVDDIYLTARTYMEGIKDDIRKRIQIEIEPAFSLIEKIVNSPSTQLLFSIHPLMLKLGKEEDYYIFQPVHTMIYALKLGFRLNYPHPELVELGLATLLQNIGMFLVPDGILHKPGALTSDEIGLIKKHPEMGRNILLPYQETYPWLPETVYQHHERENGQGYPQGLKGDDIVEYAKVIGICDSYEAMTHNRPHKKALMQFYSVRQLIESKERLFSPQILKIFLEEMSLYPIGSYVKLNNGAIGRVIRTNRLLPMKPAISLLFDGTGKKAQAGEVVDLATNGILNIGDVISEEDLPAKR